MEGAVARCAIIIGLRDPLSKRMSRPNSLAAVGLKPGNSPITLRFVTGPDHGTGRRLHADGPARARRPAARAGHHRPRGPDRAQAGVCQGTGHSSSAGRQRGADRGAADHAGRKRPNNAPIAVDPKLLTVALEAQLDSLRDEVVDLVALRARLESRMKARLEGEDWAGLEAELKEFARLTPRDQFAQRLTQLKDDAAHRQAELKTAILTKTAQAQISDLQSMIDRYLDDEAYHGLFGGPRKKASPSVAAKAKAQAKKKAAARACASPPSDTKGDAQATPAPASRRARAGQPKPEGASAPGRQSPF